MIKMSIGAAFSETFAFLKANWTKMLMWMGGTIVVLGILGYLMLGSTFAAMAMATTTNDPSVMLGRSEEHTSELQSLMRISYAVFCLKKKKTNSKSANIHYNSTEYQHTNIILRATSNLYKNQIT